MKVHVNGEPRELPDSLTVQALVPDGRGVAVAVNGIVVRATDWSATTLGEGDRVEIVTAHQGG